MSSYEWLEELPKCEAYIFPKILSLWPLLPINISHETSGFLYCGYTMEGYELSTMYLSLIYAGEPIETNYFLIDKI